MDDLLQQGITAYKAGKRDEARRILVAVVKQSPGNERAWGWLYNVCDTDKERIYCLKQILRINPGNEKANKLLNRLLKPSLDVANSPSASLSHNPFTSSGRKTREGKKHSRVGIALVISFVVVCLVGVSVGILVLPKSIPANEETIPIEKIVAMTYSAAGSQTAVSYPTPFSTITPIPANTLTVTPTTMAIPTFPVETNPPTVKADVWTSQGLEGQTVYSLAIDPKTPTTIYAGIYGNGGGVFKTTDGGENWNAANTGLTSVIIQTLVIDPITPSTIYAGTGNRGVFKSIDGGTNWGTANTGLSNSVVAAMAIDPTTPTTIYAGTSGGGVFKSIDGGASWSATNNGLTNDFVSALAIDPTMPTTIYAGTLHGVFKSTDGGANWSAGVMDPKDIHVVSLAIDPTMPTTIYAGTYTWGVFKSIDGGVNWSKSFNGLTWSMDILTLAIDPTMPTTIYAGTFNLGVFKSIDGGANWSASSTGLTAGAVSAIVIHPEMSTTLYAGTWYHGVFVTH